MNVMIISVGNIFQLRCYSILNLLCMFVALITAPFHFQLAVKCILPWQLLLLRFSQSIHILIWIYTFLPHKLKSFVSVVKLLKVLTLIIIQIRSKFILTQFHKSTTVHKTQLNIFTCFFTIFIDDPR